MRPMPVLQTKTLTINTSNDWITDILQLAESQKEHTKLGWPLAIIIALGFFAGGPAVGMLVLLISMLGLALIMIIRKHLRRGRITRSAERISAILQEQQTMLPKSFLVSPCTKCLESQMRLLAVSPNARSIEYECCHCGKKMRAAATNEKSTALLDLRNQLLTELNALNKISWPVVVNSMTATFVTQEAPLPYQQTTREPIPESIRSEVWRRDEGKCVICGVRHNLQFDHMIPVTRGGATTARNLQLLCRSCNASKSNKI